MIIYLIIVCITQFHTKLSQIPCCVVIPKSRNERSPFRGTGMIYSGKQVLSWTLKVGGKAVDFFFFFFSDLLCSSLPYLFGCLPLSLSFFTCKMELSLSPWATLPCSVAVLSLLYPSLLWHTYIQWVTWGSWSRRWWRAWGGDCFHLTHVDFQPLPAAHSTICCCWCWQCAVDNDPGTHLAWLSPHSRRRPTRGELGAGVFDLEQKP